MVIMTKAGTFPVNREEFVAARREAQEYVNNGRGTSPVTLYIKPDNRPLDVPSFQLVGVNCHLGTLANETCADLRRGEVLAESSMIRLDAKRDGNGNSRQVYLLLQNRLGTSVAAAFVGKEGVLPEYRHLTVYCPAFPTTVSEFNFWAKVADESVNGAVDEIRKWNMGR